MVPNPIGVLIRRGNEDTDLVRIQREKRVETQVEDQHLHVKERGLRSNQTLPSTLILDSSLQNWGKVKFPLFKGLVCGSLFWWPQQINTSIFENLLEK